MKLGQSAYNYYRWQVEKERKKKAEKRTQEQQVKDPNSGKNKKLEKETGQLKSTQVYFLLP